MTFLGGDGRHSERSAAIYGNNLSAMCRLAHPCRSLGAPLAEASITKAVLASDFLDWHTGFGLPQKTDDLLFTVFACSHIHHSPG